MKKEKFQAKTKDKETLTYGVWNNDMLTFQYIYEWDGTETTDLEQAELRAKELNERLLN